MLFSVVVVLAGCGSSIESKARDTLEEFDETFQDGSYVYRLEIKNGPVTKYYITEDKEYGFEKDYGDGDEVLNCGRDGFYIVDGREYPDELDDACYELEEEIEGEIIDDYNDIFSDFFNNEYDAEYTEEDDFYVIKGEDVLGSLFRFKIHTSGKQVIYADDIASYTVTGTATL